MSLRNTIIRKIVAMQMGGWCEGPVEAQRARQTGITRFNKVPADIRCQAVDANGVPAEWIEAPGAQEGVILYFHGGAYALGSIDTHRAFIGRLSRACRLRALAVGYRLAPEHPFPAALDDARTAYLWLLEQGLDAGQIIFGGDSAGGGLALAAQIALRDDGHPLPAAAVCISPWTDLALSGASVQSKAGVDPFFDSDTLAPYAAWYAAGRDLASPLLSPYYADATGLPPLLIQVGSEEVLLDDARGYARIARASGGDVTLEVWDEMFHVFQLIPFLPESKRALENIAAFTARILAGP